MPRAKAFNYFHGTTLFYHCLCWDSNLIMALTCQPGSFSTFSGVDSTDSSANSHQPLTLLNLSLFTDLHHRSIKLISFHHTETFVLCQLLFGKFIFKKATSLLEAAHNILFKYLAIRCNDYFTIWHNGLRIKHRLFYRTDNPSATWYLHSGNCDAFGLIGLEYFCQFFLVVFIIVQLGAANQSNPTFDKFMMEIPISKSCAICCN